MASGEARNQILEAAGPIFARMGFEKATVREICQAAGVNIAAINYYFGDKSRLYLQTVKRAHQLRASQVPLPAWSDETPPEERLRGFVRTLMARLVGREQAPWETQLLTREVLNPTEACKELVENHFRPTLDQLQAIVDSMLPADVPTARRRKFTFSIVGQCLFYRVAGEVVGMMIEEDELEAYGVEQLAEHIADVAITAIKNFSQPCEIPKEAAS